jgi:hypothetical protein
LSQVYTFLSEFSSHLQRLLLRHIYCHLNSQCFHVPAFSVSLCLSSCINAFSNTGRKRTFQCVPYIAAFTED